MPLVTEKSKSKQGDSVLKDRCINIEKGTVIHHPVHAKT